MNRLRIVVQPSGALERHRPLLSALELLFPVAFAGCETGVDPTEGDALISFGATRPPILAMAARGVHCYAVVSSEATTMLTAPAGPVKFHSGQALLSTFRNRSLPNSESVAFEPLECSAAEEVVASKGGRAFWIHHRTPDGAGVVIDFVSIAPPELDAGAYLIGVLNRDRFIRLLPLVHFLGRLTAGRGWQSPVRRACLVIDDPSLHLPSYGCLRFQALREHAFSRKYHVAIATVPLNCAPMSAKNADLFRRYPSQLSLLIHGNDHTWLEMARQYSETERLAIPSQALRRVTKLERQHHVDVCKVMEAPYGVIGSGMFEPLTALGYDAALITTLQFLAINERGSFTPTVGLEAASMLAGGLCMLPRIRMASGWETEVLLADLLRQPIIVAGHHFDAADGMALFETIAGMINGLGPVCWSNLTQIARGNFQCRFDGATMSVRAGSRRITVLVPEGIRRITLERPWMTTQSTGVLHISSGLDRTETRLLADAVETLDVESGQRLDFVSPPARMLDVATIPHRRTRIWPVVRRALMEVRDRVHPFLRSTRITRTASGNHARVSSPPKLSR